MLGTEVHYQLSCAPWISTFPSALFRLANILADVFTSVHDCEERTSLSPAQCGVIPFCHKGELQGWSLIGRTWALGYPSQLETRVLNLSKQQVSDEHPAMCAKLSQMAKRNGVYDSIPRAWGLLECVCGGEGSKRLLQNGVRVHKQS